MKTLQILRTAALMLALTGLTAGSDAQTLTAADEKPELVAMASARELHMEEAATESGMARGERIAASVSAVKGFEADAEMRDAIVRRLTKTAPEARVLRTVLTAEKWSVKMTEAGLPKSEYRRGVVMYELPGSNEVIQQQIVVERPFLALTIREESKGYSVRLGRVE
jgi:hypothetical protein